MIEKDYDFETRKVVASAQGWPGRLGHFAELGLLACRCPRRAAVSAAARRPDRDHGSDRHRPVLEPYLSTVLAAG